MANEHRQRVRTAANAGPQSRRSLFVVSLCFLLSGFAALVYQAAWLKKLGIVFGTSDIAVATVLAAYMAGLALGAALAARFVSRIRRPVLVYGVLEALIGISALLVPFLLEGAQRLLVVLYGGQPEPASASDLGQTVYYLIATFLILAIPTAAMGATLPLLSRYAVQEDSQVGPRVGLLYGLNTVGAVGGALAAGFLLLPYLGLLLTLLVGATVNLLVFALAWLLSRHEAMLSAEPQVVALDAALAAPAADSYVRVHWVMPVMLISGVVSFTLEVLWTRLLGHLFGGTVYAFSIMLACFLTGIALGGLAAGTMAKNRESAARVFVSSQLLISLLSGLCYWLLVAWVPTGGGLGVRAVFAFIVMVPSTLFIGATYPVAVRLAATNALNTARVAGRVYAWNTVGAIVGALLTGYFLLPALGFGLTLKAAMILSASLAFVTALLLKPRSMPLVAALAGMIAVIALLVHPARPDRLIYPQSADGQERSEERFFGVGRSATILMREIDGFINLTSNGLSESVVGRQGMPPMDLSQKWLAGLPALARPNAESMLIIGYGGGVALEGAPPNISDLDVIELEPLVIQANRAIADLRGVDPLADPRVNLVINDARNALTLTDKRYDIIVSQPSHPWTGGAAYLYTAEFLDIAQAHLTADGVFLQWINSQFVDESLLKSLMATLLSRFKYVELYQPERQDLLFLASNEPLEIWSGARGAATALQRYPRHYNRMGMLAIEDAVAMMTLDSLGVQSFAKGGQLNTDDSNRLAFFSHSRGDGLTADDMLELFQGVDPLTNPDSEFQSAEARSFSMDRIAEHLLQDNFIQRTFKMARAVHEEDVQAVIDGLGFDYSGETTKARTSFNLALIENNSNKAAQLGLLRTYLGELAQAQIPPQIGALANRQSGPDRRVFEGWVFGAAGAFDRLAGLDRELAEVSPSSLVYPIAVKLRADWRVFFSRNRNDPELAQEALEILDDLLAAYWNIDLYILRSGCAFLAGDSHALVESINAAVRQVRERIAQLDKERQKMSVGEAANLKSRLEAMRARLTSPIVVPVQSRADAVAVELNQVIEQL